MPQSLYDSLLERMEGRQYSNYFATFCPFDSHKTPALLIFEDGLATCLSCNRTWTHKQVDKKIGSHFIPQGFDTVSKVLPRWRKWEEKYGDLEGIVYYAHQSLTKHKQFQRYLKERKIYEFVDEGFLGYLDGWLTFPVYSRSSEIIDVVVRSISVHGDVRYVVKPDEYGNVRPLYCPDWKKVLDSTTIYVVYGIIDAISLHLAGLPVVTGVTGKSLPSELLRPLNKRFIIVPDAGEDREAHKLANELGMKARVRKIDYDKFENTKDPDDVRRIFGNEALLQLLT